MGIAKLALDLAEIKTKGTCLMLVLGVSIAAVALLPWILETYFFRKNLLLLIWWGFLPLSLPLALGGTQLNMPSEILLVAWVGLPLIKGVPKGMARILKHPVSILLLADLLIYSLATLNSSMPAVSVKRFGLHFAYLAGAYFLMVPVMLQRKNILKMSIAGSFGLLPVLALVLFFLSRYHFNSQVAPAAPRPFFSDHTQFGAFAALLLPFLLVTWHYSKDIRLRLSYWQKILPVLLLACVLFSFSRAVWLSIAVMLALYLLIRLRTPFGVLLFLLLTGSVVLYSYSDTLYQTILQNEAESDRQEVFEQLKSVGNVKTDVSNLERINRWKSALKMFRDRPVLGFGPGTYQFQYAPYQELRDKTVISTSRGDAGNAHSEFLMYLAETGIFGFINFLFLVVYLLYMGFKLVYTSNEAITKVLALGILLGLSGFFVHSLVNSFLETDKIGLLFYLFVASLVALDIRDRLYKAS